MPDALPIKLDSTSNGEFAPRPLGPAARAARRRGAERVEEAARRVGMGRRRFLASVCGSAAALLGIDEAFAMMGNAGGRFLLPREAAFEPAAAAARLAGGEFIFDVQTHFVDPRGAWRKRSFMDGLFGRYDGVESWLRSLPQADCGDGDPVACFSAERFVQEIFLDSDTDVAVLSFFPAPPERTPVTMAEAARARALADALGGAPRLLLHAIVLPNLEPLERQLDGMEQAAKEWGVAAWKVYTHWGPDGAGWLLDDPKVGLPFIEKARALGVKRICIHKGLSGPGGGEFSGCADVGRAAKLYPDVKFLVYHSGYQTWRTEAAYDPSARQGVDGLVRALEESGIPPGANVYAELGTTWRQLMQDPTAAAHALGKLIRAVGRDRILWGTDSIWYGSPQDQIEAFRAFEISDELCERHRYAAITPAAKARIFGLNGAEAYGLEPGAVRKRADADPIGRLRAGYAERRPSFSTYGPRNGVEQRALLAARGPLPS